MPFFTEIQIPAYSCQLDYSKRMMLLGSCFSENIGQKLLDLKFSVDMNPFGILYNPDSIANSLEILLEKKIFTADDLFQDQGVWNSFYHHSRFSDVDQGKVLEKINERISSSHDFLGKADFLAITFGTAWVYQLKQTGQIVSNCHKISAAGFNRFRLDVEQITNRYSKLLQDLLQFNPDLKFIFTVSPIRHWKDGAVENQLSKATLLLAIDKLIKEFSENTCSYFPSYEIMMDELRDYRFYAEDMLHISPVATDYIFGRFCNAMVSAESMEISAKVARIIRSVQHRPFNPSSSEYEKFLRVNLAEIEKLNAKFPFLDWSEECTHFSQELNKIR